MVCGIAAQSNEYSGGDAGRPPETAATSPLRKTRQMNIFRGFLAFFGRGPAACLPAFVLVATVPAVMSPRTIWTDVDGDLPVCGRIFVNGTAPDGDAIVSVDTASTSTKRGTGRYLLREPIPRTSATRSHVLATAAPGARTRAIRFDDAWLSGRPIVVSDEGVRCRAVDVDLRRDPANTIDAADPATGTFGDQDRDGIDDGIEDWLAERFAPIVHHGDAETSFPVDVDWWLERTHLAAVDASVPRRARRIAAGPLRQDHLLGHSIAAGPRGERIFSSGTRSRGKRSSFFLENVAPDARPGEKQRPGDWVTYVHSYANDSGGITLQYWRAYAWNDARFLLADVGHGGDWESIAVHLDSRLQPSKVAFLDHTGIVYETSRVQWSGTHPLVWSEEGGHSSAPDRARMRSRKWITQETWTGGAVSGPNGEPLGRSGGLRNVGEKSRPRNGQVFVQYAGLWGSRRTLFITSGYWGPAFNETGAQCAGGGPAYSAAILYPAESPACGRVFMKAWCDAMNAALLNRSEECYAKHDSP